MMVDKVSVEITRDELDKVIDYLFDKRVDACQCRSTQRRMMKERPAEKLKWEIREHIYDKAYRYYNSRLRALRRVRKMAEF